MCLCVKWLINAQHAINRLVFLFLFLFLASHTFKKKSILNAKVESEHKFEWFPLNPVAFYWLSVISECNYSNHILFYYTFFLDAFFLHLRIWLKRIESDCDFWDSQFLWFNVPYESSQINVSTTYKHIRQVKLLILMLCIDKSEDKRDIPLNGLVSVCWLLTGRRWGSFLWIANSKQTTGASVIIIFIVYTFQQWLRVRVFGRIRLKWTEMNRQTINIFRKKNCEKN